MAMNNEQRQEKMDAFWARVHKAVGEDNGLRATFRRNAGELLQTADGRAVTAFYRVCVGVPISKGDEDKCFFAICAACLWKPEEWPRAVSLMAGARILNPDERGTLEKRLRVLLDLPWDDEGYFAAKLCRLLKYCRSKSLVIDGKSLMKDLTGWDSDKRFVQKRWVREFYREDEKFESKGADE